MTEEQERGVCGEFRKNHGKDRVLIMGDLNLPGIVQEQNLGGLKNIYSMIAF